MNRDSQTVTRNRCESYSSSTNDLWNSNNKVELVTALKEISKIAFPTMFFFIGVYMQQTINLIFIGHTYKENQKDALDAVGVSHLYINCTLLSMVIGLITGFDTLGSNSYGAKKYYLFGLYFHRSILIAFVFSSGLFIFHFFYAIKVLALLGIENSVLVLVNEYIHIMMFWVLPDIIFTVCFRYLNIVGKAHINLSILVISLAIHPLWCYIFINKLGLGLRGAGLSLTMTSIVNFILTGAYIIFFPPVFTNFSYFSFSKIL
jgi:MATE family multidrug resistance protein